MNTEMANTLVFIFSPFVYCFDAVTTK